MSYILLMMVIQLIFSITILWKAGLLAIKKKKISLFLPFLVIGILFGLSASFIFHNILFDRFVWIGIELSFFIALIAVWPASWPAFREK